MEEIQIDDQQNNDQQNNDQNVDGDDDDMNREALKCSIGIIVWRTILLIPFIIVNFYFWAQSQNNCDYGLSLFLLTDAILGSIRLLDPIIFFATGSYNYLIFEKIIYNIFALIWIISGFIYGFINLSCSRTQYTSTYILFWVSLSSSFIYRLFVCIIPAIYICGFGINEQYKQNKIVKFVSKLDPLSFLNGSLVDSKGAVVTNLDKDDDKCAICLEDYGESNEKIIRLNCGHHFHQACNKEWLKDHTVCPYCKKVVTQV